MSDTSIISFNNCLTVIGVLSSILTIVTFFSGDKIPFLKKANYILRNKRIKVKISSVRTYSYFQENTNLIARNIREVYGKTIEDLTVGKNKIQILIKDAQAPYLIEFTPNISNFEEAINEINVEIKILGTLTFRYRDDNENRNHITNIEGLYKIIEKTYNISPVFEDYVLKSTISDFVEEDWKKVNTIKVENGVVYMGKKVLDIHLALINPLYDIYKNKITHL
ncbi:MAG: hypothetical protein RBR26_02355 [Methanosarcina mazei]|nr:hypothetical protein [Methanosarcina mazei]